jgi:hypothetical protein
MSQVLYRHRAVSPLGWAIPVGLWVVGALLLLAFVAPRPLDTVTVVLCLIGPGLICGVWLNMLYGITRYGDITVTSDTLRVGRHRRPLAQLDRRWLDPATATTLPANGEVGELMGGAWGTTFGGGVLVSLQLVDGSRVSVQTKDREGLVAALRRAIDSPGAAPAR